MDLATLRAQWSDVLDYLERQDRMAWIAFFDARLARLEADTLYLDFSDPRKFAGNLEYANIRDHHRNSLRDAILAVAGVELAISEDL